MLNTQIQLWQCSSGSSGQLRG